MFIINNSSIQLKIDDIFMQTSIVTFDDSFVVFVVDERLSAKRKIVVDKEDDRDI